ncbi:hypothetical protein [Gymnodinialimonas ulvae]|uniref:hypothetical protein n=1 Tax=Gymnodinialimonas ulvae TaxID=3126504 RepID=UPI00309CB6A8
MTVYKARYAIGLLVLIGHFVAIAVFVYLVDKKVLDADFLTYADGVAVLAPFTLLYATVFYRYVAANPRAVKADKRRKFDTLPFLVQFVTVLLFVMTLIGSIVWAFNNINDIEGVGNISAVVGIVDTVFAVFVSMTFSQLFPLEWEQQTGT